jgi:hypothetical protein
VQSLFFRILRLRQHHTLVSLHPTIHLGNKKKGISAIKGPDDIILTSTP